jgi:hypothetical protein
MKPILLITTASALAPVTAVAHADEHERAQFSAGAQGLLGGSLYSAPDNPPPNYDGLGFVGEAGGFSWGAGAYGEFRPIRFLGLSLGLGYDRIRLQRNVTYNNVLETTESVTASNLRLGFLVKGILPGPFGRAWLGLGPEFLVPLGADAALDVTSGGQFAPPGLNDVISARTGGSTLLSFALGLVFDAGPVEIPLELRASRNLSQESAWADRVALDPTTLAYEVTARSDWDFRLGLGVGVAF